MMETETRTYAKLVEGQLITTCVPDDDPDMLEQILADGFKLYDEDAGQPEVGPFQSLNPVYLQEEDRISLYWEIVNDDPEKVQAEIDRLEELISATDYRVIKSYEYALAGVSVPYDVTTLHHERQALRDQINELKALLDTDAPEETLLDDQYGSGMHIGGKGQ